LPLPAHFLYRGAVGPVHLKERHAFFEAFHDAWCKAEVRAGEVWLRVISLNSEGNQARRHMIEMELLEPARRELQADAEFFDAVNGRALGLRSDAMGLGEKQQCLFHRLSNGLGLWADVDTSFWVGLADEPMRLAHLRKHASMFQAELDRSAFHHGLYNPAIPALGMVGNHLSHAALWHEIDILPDRAWGLVVEDDAIVDPNFGASWPEVLRAFLAEVTELRRKDEEWDCYFLGRMTSGTPEGRDVTALSVEVGWTLRTHCIAYSRRGVRRLIEYGLSSHVFHCAMDEVLASMAAGDHWHQPFAKRLRELGCLGRPFRILGFKFEGVVWQLMDAESSERAESQCVGPGAEKI